MTIVFLSPNFPPNYGAFCANLKLEGVPVCGIGDADFFSMHSDLRDSLDWYCRVDSLYNYQHVRDAFAYLQHRYGPITAVESLNEAWLETEARLRTEDAVGARARPVGLEATVVEDVAKEIKIAAHRVRDKGSGRRDASAATRRLHLHPSPLRVALEDGFAELHLLVAVLRVRKNRGRSLSAGDVLVDRAVVHLVRIGEALGVAAGVVGEMGDVLVEAGSAALADFIRCVAAADVQDVRVLEFPAHAALRAVDADGEAAFPSGGDLRDARIRMDTVGVAVRGFAEVQQHAGEVLGVHLVAHHVLRVHFRESLHLAARALADLEPWLERVAAPS